ncbi:MAG: putative quinol monooxygenase [Acidobacteriota bacterium]
MTSSDDRPTMSEIDRRKALALALGGAATLGFQRAAQAEDLANAITQTAAFQLAEGKEEEGRKILAELVAAVEANEPGVLAYICHQASDDPNKVFFFEIYKDQEALTNHGGQPHMANLMSNIGTLFLPPFEIVKMDRIAGFSR